MTAAEMRSWRGPALFSFGFRPFFLFGALWAGLDAPIWVSSYLAGAGTVLGASGRDWHVHEMLFGYLAAVMAGFLTTAVPNWTGRLPVIGWRLASLFGLWAAGRLAMLLQARVGAATAVVDAAFLVCFAAVIWREVIVGRNWRNLPVCGIVTLFALANIGFHLRGPAPWLADLAERLALAAPAMLIAVIGGRIVPSFTRNWLMQQRASAMPAPTGRLDLVVLILTGAALLAWVAFPTALVAGALLALAGIANAARLTRWRGLATAREALVWSLHAGYGWLSLALLLLGVSVLAPVIVPRTAALHALGAGAFGVMTLAVMTRATLGHTGQPRTANHVTTLIYAAVNAAALVRVVAAFEPALQMALLPAAAVLWSLAFLGFVAVYGPMLASRRSS
jgi:uncharacterized protein involved in response to NO